MPRRASLHWDKREQCYRTEAGGVAKYFRGIARDDHVGIATAFSSHLAALVAEAKPPQLDVLDLIGKFTRANRGVRPKTSITHKERLIKWARWSSACKAQIAEKPIDEVRTSDLTRPLAEWKTAGLSDHYRAGIVRSVKAMFAWASSEDGGNLIPSDPLVNVAAIAVERSPERYASRKEVADFLRFAWRRAAAPRLFGRRKTAVMGPLYRRFGRLLALMIRVGVHTGTRPGDLCCAWWEDFDPKKGIITLPPDRHKTGGKTGRPLVIHLGKPLTRTLARWKADPGRHPVSIFVHKRGRGSEKRGAMSPEQGEPWGKFVTRNGKPSFDDDSTPLAQAIRKLRIGAIADQKARGVTPTIVNDGDNRFVFYRLRHTKASDMMMGGGASGTVAELLGTSPRILETVYSHYLEEHLASEAERLRGRKRPEN